MYVPATVVKPGLAYQVAAGVKLTAPPLSMMYGSPQILTGATIRSLFVIFGMALDCTCSITPLLVKPEFVCAPVVFTRNNPTLANEDDEL